MASSSRPLLAVVMVATWLALPSSTSAGGGLVVEGPAPDGAAARAGIEVGDVLVAWAWRPSGGDSEGVESGSLESPFDLQWLQVERAQHGRVTLTVRRAADTFSAELPPGVWRLTTRPADAPDTATEGVGTLVETADLSAARGDSRRAGWLLLAAAERAAAAQPGAGGEALFDRALSAAREAGRPWSASWIEESRARILGRSRQQMSARRAARQGLEIRLGLQPDGTGIAGLLTELGVLTRDAGEPEGAARALGAALSIQRRRAPSSLAIASALANLGTVAGMRGELDAAERLFMEAIDHQRSIDPGSSMSPYLLHSLGRIATMRGDLASAERHYRASIAILAATRPDSPDLAQVQESLGITAYHRWDLAAADEALRQALSIYRRHPALGLDVARILNSLGAVALRRGNLEEAEGRLGAALEQIEGLGPGSPLLADVAENLGVVAARRGDLVAASRYHHQALAEYEKIAPNSIALEPSLTNLGFVALQRGNLAESTTFYSRVLELCRRHAPGSLRHARALANLAEVALLQGELDRAEDLATRAQALHREIVPNSFAAAASEHILARIALVRDRPRKAAEWLDLAMTALEAQQGRIGGTEQDRAIFRATSIDIYRDAVEVEVELGRADRALHTLERFRAQELLALLAERDLVFSADLPQDLEAARRRLAVAHDRAFARLMELSPTADATRVTGVRAEIADITRRQDDLRRQVLELSPHLAALTDPEPLPADEIRAVLDPGTTLLAYSLGRNRSQVFILPAGGELRVAAIPQDEDTIGGLVDRLRLLTSQPRSTPAARDGGRRLSDLLLAPAAAEVEAAERILIVPDGPLATVPFAALVGSDGLYLGETKPVHIAPSSTVYARLRDRRTRRETVHLVAFGDPVYPASLEGETRDAPADVILGRQALPRLPSTRDEVEALRRIFGDQTTAFLGQEATEGRARELGDATIVHFAVHARADEHLPLESFLALSVPQEADEAQDNGLLQAWEIFEQVRVDADLVTLSACSTALGQEVAGEGIIGLTRAFHYAGARTVLASLWQVADATTAELMARFYRRLAAGAPKDVALQQAQRSFLEGPVELPDGSSMDASHPYYWAGFELFGDWR
jgi:CHAT domain-containing protein/Tfp pilus assembly protein PilF